MKKITLITLILLYNISAISQQQLTNIFTSITIPSNAKKISREQAISHVSKKFNNDQFVLYGINNDNISHKYVINDILISLFLFDTTIHVNPDHVLELKDGLDGMHRKNNSYTSQLKSINNNSIIITNYIHGNIEYYHFYCFNSNNTHQINGRLEFNIIDADNATATLNSLLESIRFKN